MYEKLNHAFSRVPSLLRNILIFFLIGLAGFGILFLCGYLILFLLGIYSKLESALNLSANSRWITFPLYGSIVLAIAFFILGVVLYFRKYTRPRIRTKFGVELSTVLEKELQTKEHIK